MISKRVTELDGLRGIAAIVVVVFHYFYRYEQLYGHQFQVAEFLMYGKYGVHLFFMVSGFVIFWTISKCKQPLDFLWARFSRLYPPFWVATTLTFTIVYFCSLPGREVSFGTYLANLLMFHEYFSVQHVDGVFWTLTIELAFYFWILIIFSLGQLKNIEKILCAWLVIAGIVTYNSHYFQIHHLVRKFLILDYIELFAAGICFYLYKSKANTMLTNINLMITVFFIWLSFPKAAVFLIFGAHIVFYLIVLDKARLLRCRLLTYFGTVSYSLYLIHQNIGYIIINKSYALGLNPIVGIFIAFSFSVVIAHLMFSYVEKPSLKLMKGFYLNNRTALKLRAKLEIF